MVIDLFELLSILDGLIHVLFFFGLDVQIFAELFPPLGDAMVKVFDFLFFLLLLQLEVLLELLKPGYYLTIGLRHPDLSGKFISSRI